MLILEIIMFPVVTPVPPPVLQGPEPGPLYKRFRELMVLSGKVVCLTLPTTRLLSNRAVLAAVRQAHGAEWAAVADILAAATEITAVPNMAVEGEVT
jgi:hypothetical protein